MVGLHNGGDDEGSDLDNTNTNVKKRIQNTGNKIRTERWVGCVQNGGDEGMLRLLIGDYLDLAERRRERVWTEAGG